MTREGCHLCEEARSELDAHLASLGETARSIEVVEIDIESDDELHRRYLERIPVIAIDGEAVSEFAFDAAEFDACLERQARQSG
jgi:glutaredoxin